MHMRAFSPKIWVALFGIAAIAQSLTFYLQPVLVPVVTGALVVVIGCITLLASIATFGGRPSWAAGIAILLSLAIGAAWLLIPTRQVAEIVRFKVKESSFKEAIAELAHGSQPACIRSQDCMIDNREPSYVIFPYPGLLTGWVGVIYSSTGSIDPAFSGRQTFGRVNCNPTPLEKGFFLCGFY
jgi:hypothetical protein